MEDRDENKEIVGFCDYCKHIIYEDEDFIVKKGVLSKIYHSDCWLQKHSFEEEIEFE